MRTKRKLTRDEEFRVVTTKLTLAPPVQAFESLATALRQVVLAVAEPECAAAT